MPGTATRRPPPSRIDPGGQIAAFSSTFAIGEAVPEDAWQRGGTRSNGDRFTVDSLARYHLHDLVHHAHDVSHVTKSFRVHHEKTNSIKQLIAGRGRTPDERMARAAEAAALARWPRDGRRRTRMHAKTARASDSSPRHPRS